MDDLSRLSNALMTLDDKLATCMRCGMCQATCPVYGVTMIESDVTRGKIALLSNLAHKLIEDPAAVQEKVNRCLLCGLCESSCPSGVSIIEIFMEARAIVATYQGFSPAKQLLFRNILPNPRLFAALVKITKPLRGLLLKSQNNLQQTCTAPILQSMLGNRHIPKPAPTPLHARLGALNSPAGKSRIKVAFFPGCLVDQVYLQVADACLKIFDYHEVGVFFATNFACCGIPALAAGDRQGFERMVKQNVDVLSAGTFDYILSPCGSCVSTIRDTWPQMSKNMPYRYRDIINELSMKTVDIHTFLTSHFKLRPKPHRRASERITYHEACHVHKDLKVTHEPRTLLNMNNDYQLVEMEKPGGCCGCGGSFTLTHYDLACKIAEVKRAQILKTEAEVVATSCPACMGQISDVLAKHNDPIIVRHTLEVYADSLK